MPATVVTALTVAVMAGPVVTGASVTVTRLGVMVPLGKFVPVTLRTVTPGWPALGETVVVSVTGVGLWPFRLPIPKTAVARIKRKNALSR